MAKNFRFHEDRNVVGWDESSPLNEKAIAAIKDPDGGNADREITSIPSPFARIDLVKSAFSEVANGKLEGKTIYHKMVSDALDIGEIFFNYDKYKEEIEIITWNPEHDLQILLNSDNIGHQHLGRTLEIYFNQDAAIYNFDYKSNLYLINYKKGKDLLNIIGGTSPASLFFTSANKFDLKGFHSGKDKFFDDDYNPLHKRDHEYVKYIFALKRQFKDDKDNLKFPDLFKNVDDYLIKVYKELPSTLKEEISKLDSHYFDTLPTLNIADGGTVVEILNVQLRKSKGKEDAIRHNSAFRLEAEREYNGTPLLVLPNDNITGNFLYVTDHWDNHNKAPSFVNEKIEERILPFDGTKYPYLTISDLLEPVIIRTSMPIDDFYFEKAGYKGNKSYLLPLKPLFFDYFSKEFLNKTINGEKVFELKALSGDNVQALLRIPVQNGKNITFKRIYYNSVNQISSPEFDETTNKGAIIENRINLGVTPFYKFPPNIKPEYNISFYEEESNQLLKDIKYDFSFFDSENNIINGHNDVQRRYKEEEARNMFSYIVEENFDYIQLRHFFGTGILIPKLKNLHNGGNGQFSFAIDFGTTNTHVEFREDDKFAESLQFTSKENYHLGVLIDQNALDDEEAKVFVQLVYDDLLPKVIENESVFKLPQRTVVAYHSRADFTRPVFSMGNVNIPFKYEQAGFATSTEIKTNLKWNTEDSSKTIMKAFFEQLIKMIRNKILLNNGSLQKTKIIWSYPASMPKFLLINMESQWNQTINEYLGDNISIENICESLSPFYYFKEAMGVGAIIKPGVTIDIGGGTSDVAVFKDEKPVLFTSYRFAGDAIFGDNYKRNINQNGFVNRYHSKIIGDLKNNNSIPLATALEKIRSRNNSNDLINAFFSLENNRNLQKKKINISFLDRLKNDAELKIIFLLFYVAQIYHLANIMRKKQIDVPGIILFSGTASKLLNTLDASTNKILLKKLTNKIFDLIFVPTEDSNIDLILDDNPKMLTAKGALYLDSVRPELEDIKEVLITNKHLQSELEDLNINLLNFKYDAINDYNDFLDLFFKLDSSVSFKDHFGIESRVQEVAKVFLHQKKEASLASGIQKMIDENKDEDKVSETLFFYPLVGSLGELASQLTKN